MKSPNKDKILKLDIKELNKFVFEETKAATKRNRHLYTEEDSYQNQSNSQQGLL